MEANDLVQNVIKGLRLKSGIEGKGQTPDKE